MMDEFIKKNKGPLIAISSAAVGLVVLIIISALANMPTASEINIGQFLANIFWMLLIGGLLAGILLFMRERLASDEKDDEEEEEAALTLADSPHQLAQGISALFGTTDMNQITTGIQAMYAELEKLRALSSDQDAPHSLAAKVSEQERIITTLTNERDQAQAAREKWQAKAISSTQEVSELREEIKEHGKWEVVDEEKLAAFFPTVTLGDRSTEKPFLSSKRRQRRLIQRLSAEGYFIVKNAS